MGDLAAPVGKKEENVLLPLTNNQLQNYQLSDANKEFMLGVEKAVYEQVETKAEEFIPRPVIPETYSLLAPINVPYDTTAKEILSMSAKRILTVAGFKPIFDEEFWAPSPPLPTKVEDEAVQDRIKHTRLPAVYSLKTRQDAFSQQFREKCEKEPIALVRGFTTATEMDLSVYETSRISAVAGSEKLDIRSQNFVSLDKNVDKKGEQTWECWSKKGTWTIKEYEKYQTGTLNMSLEEEAEKLRQSGSEYAQQTTKGHGGKRRRLANAKKTAVPKKPIKFGTNVDLSNESKWETQLGELEKCPPFIRHNDPQNILSHIGYQVLGMNTVQLYMKVPGSRTPAHQENNSFASININIGPGDCEWFAVPYEYWGVIEKLCKKHNIDYLRDSYWPNLEELLAENVPVYRFTQKPGDLVWVGYGCVHWVQAVGVCNNIAWNVGPLNSDQLSVSIRSYEWNKLKTYKSLVPLQHLAWQLAKNVKFPDKSTYALIRGILIRSLSFCKIVVDYATTKRRQFKPYSRVEGDNTHYCFYCQVEVFNIIFAKEVDGESEAFCVYCSQQQGLANFEVYQQFKMSELTEIYDNMVLNQPPNIALTA